MIFLALEFWISQPKYKTATQIWTLASNIKIRRSRVMLTDCNPESFPECLLLIRCKTNKRQLCFFPCNEPLFISLGVQYTLYEKKKKNIHLHVTAPTVVPESALWHFPQGENAVHVFVTHFKTAEMLGFTQTLWSKRKARVRTLRPVRWQIRLFNSVILNHTAEKWQKLYNATKKKKTLNKN